MKKYLTLIAFSTTWISGCCYVDDILKLADLVFSSEFVQDELGQTASATTIKVIAEFKI